MAAALVPALAAMYAFYWLDASGTWHRDTPHRGKLSVLLLSSGIALSFVVQGQLAKRFS